MTFSREKIHIAGYVADVIIIVLNSNNFMNVECVGEKTIRGGEALLGIRK